MNTIQYIYDTIYLFQTAVIYIKHMYMYYDILKQQFVVRVKVTRTCLGRDQKTNIDKYGIIQTVPMRTHATSWRGICRY